MSSVYPKVAPCFLEHWPCKETDLPCYTDCCQRGTHFCNHREMRCQACTYRETECGNASMPWECDSFCLMKTTGPAVVKSFDTTYYQQPWMYSTCALSVLTVALALALCFTCRRNKRHRPSPPPSSVPFHNDDDENDFLMELKILGCSKEDKEVQTDDLHESLDPTAADRQGQDLTVNRDPALPSQPSGYCGQQASPGRAPQSVTYSHPCPNNGGVCHDPRLDNVPPADDARGDFPVNRTGHAPFYAGANNVVNG